MSEDWGAEDKVVGPLDSEDWGAEDAVVGDRKNTWDESVMARGQALLDGLMFGFGDEFAAGGRTLVGQVFSAVDPRMKTEDWGKAYDRELERGRLAEERERETSGGTMTALEVAGAVPSGLKASLSVGNAATRIGNIGRQGGVGAAEMAVREFAEGEGSATERYAETRPEVVALGAGAGALGGALMRGQRSIDELARQAAAGRTAQGNVTQAGLENQSSLGRAVSHVRDDLYTNVKEEVGEGVARTMVDADSQGMRWKQALHAEDVLPVKKLDNLSNAFMRTPQAAKLVNDANAVINGSKLPVGMRGKSLDAAESVLRRNDPEAADTLRKMRDEVGLIQQELRRVFPKMADEFEENYMAILAKPTKKAKGFQRTRSTSRVDSSTMARETGFMTAAQAKEVYETPVHSFMNFFEDAVDALALARKFGVKAETKGMGKMSSYTEEVVKAIEKKHTQELGEEGAKRLGDNLRLFAIDGRTGMGELMSVLRMGSHAALLGTPENAILQLGDLGASAYATSFRDAVAGLPKALRSVLLTDGDMIVANGGMKNVLRGADLGISRQHLTEMVNESSKVWPKRVSNLADFLMSSSGVRKMDRLGKETLLNAEYNEMKRLASKGIEAVKNSKYAEGLSDAQVDRLIQGIQSGNVRDRAVLDAAFFGLGRMQPVSRTAMPPAYLDAKNGRLLWSMKMYMTKMASKFNEDVLRPVRQAEEAGVTSEKGRALLKKATYNTARYSTFILALNALVDPGRKELLRGKESPNTYGEEVVRQGVSFATGGVVDPNNIRYGRTVSESFIPPAIAAATTPIELAVRGLMTDQEISPAQMESASRFVPGIRQLLWTEDVIKGGE